MRKLLMLMVVAGFMAICFAGCDNEKVEDSWEKAKVVHSVAKTIGKAAIDNGVVGEDTAQKLKDANTIVESAGGGIEYIYEGVHTEKKQDVDTNTDTN